ncbi:hypothetical protein [Nonomuraea ceibae]|uniref:hypothetical protein n=1 Tax=Nonomuraea ceibae TaxID=1935170 RepID=UPI001C5F9720|nr:hypothetical protein [Nonomuraea ceibae]
MSGEPGQGIKRLVPNNVLIAKRQAKGWSRNRVAREMERAGLHHGLGSVPDLDAIEKAVYRHETGRAVCRDPLYMELYCLVYGATSHELFGDIGQATPDADTYGVRSHKFVCAYIGADRVAALVERGVVKQADMQLGVECHAGTVLPSPGACQLRLWPFGVAVFHIREDVKFPNIASLAVWRRKSYGQNLDWGSRYLSDLTDADVKASYVLSLYWLHEPMWSGAELDTATRIMSTPRVLLERDSEESESSLGHAELVERALLAEGFDHAEIVPFGIKGISIGHASWSGVVYCPLAPQRALAEDELVATELATQAVWAYCEHINSQIEQGRDPDVPEPYGWRFLRGVRSRLTNARPQETGQHRSMRAAILETSGLVDHLTQAIDVLRETSER